MKKYVLFSILISLGLSPSTFAGTSLNDSICSSAYAAKGQWNFPVTSKVHAFNEKYLCGSGGGTGGMDCTAPVELVTGIYELIRNASDGRICKAEQNSQQTVADNTKLKPNGSVEPQTDSDKSDKKVAVAGGM